MDKSQSDTSICYNTITESEDFVNTLATNDLFIRSLNIILNCLNKTERFIILCRMSDLFQEDISLFLDCTQSYVSRLGRRAYPKIKQMLKKTVTTSEVYKFDKTSSFYTLSIDLGYIDLSCDSIISIIFDLAFKFLMYKPKVYHNDKKNILVLNLLSDNNCFIFIAFLINTLSTDDKLDINHNIKLNIS